MKTLRKNIHEKLYDIRSGDDFLDMTPKVQATKEKVDKLNFIET